MKVTVPAKLNAHWAEFFETIYGDAIGTIRLARWNYADWDFEADKPARTEWTNQYFDNSAEGRRSAADWCVENCEEYNIGFSAALFDFDGGEPQASAQYATRGTYAITGDYDDDITGDELAAIIAEGFMVWASGTPDHVQYLGLVEECIEDHELAAAYSKGFAGIIGLERVEKRHSYEVIRLPWSYNLKRGERQRVTPYVRAFKTVSKQRLNAFRATAGRPRASSYVLGKVDDVRASEEAIDLVGLRRMRDDEFDGRDGSACFGGFIKECAKRGLAIEQCVAHAKLSPITERHRWSHTNVESQVWKLYNEINDERLASYPNKEFWQSREYLQKVRQAADANGVSPLAMFNMTSVVASTAMNPRLAIPRVGSRGHRNPLTLFGGIYGSSGAGKDSITGVVADLLDCEVYDSEPGSFEAIPKMFARREGGELEVYRDRALALYPEGNIFPDILKNKPKTSKGFRGSWSGTGLKSEYSDRTKAFNLRGFRFNLGLLVLLQPEEAAAWEGEIRGGLFQRINWASADFADHSLVLLPDLPAKVHVPTLDPDNPLDVEVDNRLQLIETPVPLDGLEVVSIHPECGQVVAMSKLRRAYEKEPLYARHDALVAIRLAVHLMIMDGRSKMNEEDVALAVQVQEMFRDDRAHFLDLVHQAQKRDVRVQGRLRAQASNAAAEHTLKLVQAWEAVARFFGKAENKGKYVAPNRIISGMTKSLQGTVREQLPVWASEDKLKMKPSKTGKTTVYYAMPE